MVLALRTTVTGLFCWFLSRKKLKEKPIELNPMLNADKNYLR